MTPLIAMLWACSPTPAPADKVYPECETDSCNLDTYRATMGPFPAEGTLAYAPYGPEITWLRSLVGRWQGADAECKGRLPDGAGDALWSVAFDLEFALDPDGFGLAPADGVDPYCCPSALGQAQFTFTPGRGMVTNDPLDQAMDLELWGRDVGNGWGQAVGAPSYERLGVSIYPWESNHSVLWWTQRRSDERQLLSPDGDALESVTCSANFGIELQPAE